MKRTAAEAGFPAEGNLTRVKTTFRLLIAQEEKPWSFTSTANHSTDTIDQVKCRLQYLVEDATGRCPKLSSFQLHQASRHVAFTEPITALHTLEPVNVLSKK